MLKQRMDYAMVKCEIVKWIFRRTPHNLQMFMDVPSMQDMTRQDKNQVGKWPFVVTRLKSPY